MFVSLSDAPQKIPKYLGRIGFSLVSYVRPGDDEEKKARPRLIVSFPRRTRNLMHVKDQLLEIMDTVTAENLRVSMALGVPGTPDEGLASFTFSRNEGIKITPKHESEASVTFCIPSHIAAPFRGKTVNRVWTEKWGLDGKLRIVVVVPKELRPITDHIAVMILKIRNGDAADEVGGRNEAA